MIDFSISLWEKSAYHAKIKFVSFEEVYKEDKKTGAILFDKKNKWKPERQEFVHRSIFKKMRLAYKLQNEQIDPKKNVRSTLNKFAEVECHGLMAFK